MRPRSSQRYWMKLCGLTLLFAACSSSAKHGGSDVSPAADDTTEPMMHDAGSPASDSMTAADTHDAGVQLDDAGPSGAGGSDGKAESMDASTRSDAGENPDAGADAATQSTASVTPLVDAGCPRESVACNTACIPAGKSADSCEALRVESQVEALALSGDKLYVSENRGIFELDLPSQAYRQLGQGKISTSHELAIAGRSLVLTVDFGSTRQVLRYDLDTDQVQVLADGLKAAAEDVRVANGSVFYLSSSLFRVPLTGGTAEQLTAAAYRVHGYVVDGDTLFTLTDALRKRSLKDGQGSETVLQMNFPGEQLFADATHLYTKDTGMLRRVPRMGGDAEVLPGPRINGVALTSDGADVYFGVGSADGVVTRVTLGAMPKSAMVYEGSWPMAAATGAGFLYVGLYPSARGSGVVKIALKP